MRTLRNLRLVRWVAAFVVTSLASLGTAPAFGMAHRQDEASARQARYRAAALLRAQGLPAGLTQTPDARLRAKIAAKEAAAQKPVADARPLSAGEMKAALGRGPFRNAYFNGTLPWQKSLRDVNLCNGNLFKSFTDVQVAPGRGAGLVLQRTYNSNDARIGPFGVGWTHAYDIRVEESANVRAEAGDPSGGDADSINEVPRTDFFGGKHTYHRDADGLYSPPAYLYDEMSSDYDEELANGPKVISDTEKGMDGTVKHYMSVLTLADGTEGNERACDYIEDRHGNRTVLAYGQTTALPDGSTRKLLTAVTDPSGRVLTFHWTNLGTPAQPAWRITEVDAPNDPATGLPVYRVAYGYYADPSDAASYLNLHTVTLDPDGLARTTTYAYTSYTGTYTDQSGSHSATENGLLASVADPLGHVVSYQYGLGDHSNIPVYTGTLWVTQVAEPGSGGTHYWSLYQNQAPGGSPGSVTYVDVPRDYSGGSFDRVLYVGVELDSFLRVSALIGCEGGPPGTSPGHPYRYGYDAANNLAWKDCEQSAPASGMVCTYGAHGNVLTQRAVTDSSLTPYAHGTDTAYFNASKYFAKQSVTDALGRVTAMDYFDDVDPAPGNRGEVAWVRDAGYNASASPSYHKQFTYTYNQYGQKASETNLNGVVTQYTYGDAWGNLTQVVQDPGGAGHLARTTTMAYDVMGRVKQSTDPAGQVSTFAYNSLGQPLTVHTPAKGSSPAETVSYAYGTNGRTESVTDNRGTTSFVYEAGSDRVASVTDPQTGTTGYTYELSGERKTVTLPGGGTWAYAYYSRAAGGGTYWQTGAPIEVLPGEDPNSVSPSLRSVTDDQGRRVECQSGDTGALLGARFGQTFDAQGNLVAYAQTDYEYPYLWQYASQGLSWAPQGQLRGLTTAWHWQEAGQYGQPGPWHARLVSQSVYTYDDTGQRLTNQSTAMAPGTNGAPQYTGGSPSYDGSGNATNLVTTTRTEHYAYDDVNRLNAVDYGDGQTQGYSFDAMGNRTQRVDSVAGTTAYAFDNANRLTTVGAASYTNDADGNTLTGGGRTNAWDSANRLVSSLVNGTSSAFTYGADGLRRSSTVTPSGGSATTTRYAYDGQTMVRSLRQNAQGAWQAAATYLTGPRGTEYRRDDLAGTVRWYVYDGLGSVVGELDPAGNLTAGKKYDVYGAERAGGTGASTTRQGFCGSLGHIADAETGLVYMRARYYDPSVGRFTSEDPKQNGNNWFAYCENNPVNFVDETGKSSDPVTKIDQWKASEGYLALAISFISIFFLLKYGKTPVQSAVCAILACYIGAELIADALKDIAPGGQAVAVTLGLICNAIFGAVKADKSFKSFLGGVVGNVAAGYLAYYGICEAFTYLM